MNSIVKSTLPPIKTARDLEAAGLTQIDYILLDGSSSMSGRIADALVSIDAYADSLKANGVRTSIHLATFTSGYGNGNEVDYQTFHPTTPDTWESCRGLTPGYRSTPLYDAINIMCRAVRDLNPQKASILIYTDGEDTGSNTSVAQARALLDWCRAKGWQVTFIGCDFNNLKEARLLGANDSNAIGTSAKRLTDVTRELGKKRANYDQYGTDISFSDAEKQQFGGYLSYDSNGK